MSCSIYPICFLNTLRGYSRTLIPSINIFPLSGSYNRKTNFTNVVFPQPVGPTRATLSLGSIIKDILLRIGAFELFP